MENIEHIFRERRLDEIEWYFLEALYVHANCEIFKGSYRANLMWTGCKRARGIINRLPIAQRAKHYSRINQQQSKLRAMV